MTVRNRIYIPNQTYFITFTILGWKKIFVDKQTIDLVYKWFDYIKNKYGNEIEGYVIMPNHLHVLMKTSSGSPKPAILIMNAKRFMAYEIVKYLEKTGQRELLDYFRSHARGADRAKHKIFTDRYDSQIIQSLKFFLQKLNYIHNNPCQEKWQLAKSPEKYLYSSAANYTSGKGFYEIKLVNF
jgi:REP element-mobilizing transposase RayT